MVRPLPLARQLCDVRPSVRPLPALTLLLDGESPQISCQQHGTPPVYSRSVQHAPSAHSWTQAPGVSPLSCTAMFFLPSKCHAGKEGPLGFLVGSEGWHSGCARKRETAESPCKCEGRAGPRPAREEGFCTVSSIKMYLI